jgi:hypothetical protein
LRDWTCFDADTGKDLAAEVREYAMPNDFSNWKDRDAFESAFIGAAIYNWRLSAANAPTVVLQTAQTTAASNVFDNLTPGVVYNIEANAVGSAGPSDWSDAFPHMAM